MKFGRRIAFDINETEESHMWKAAGTDRFAWNWGLGRWNEDYARAKTEADKNKQNGLWPSGEKLKKEWCAIRKDQFPWSLEVTKCAGSQAIMDLASTFSRAQKEVREAKQQGRKPRKQFGFPKFKAKGKVTPSFAIWNDQFTICHHHSLFHKSYSTVKIPNLGHVKLREFVSSIGGILGARVSYRRGRWYIAFQFDCDWNNGEQSDKAAEGVQSKARKAAMAAGMSKEDAKETIHYASDRPERLQPLHPLPDSIGAHDLGLIDTLRSVGKMSGGKISDRRVRNPRRLTRSERETKRNAKRQRKLSRSIHRARVKAATAAKLARCDTSPLNGKELQKTKLKLSNRQKKQQHLLNKDVWKLANRREDFLHKLSHGVAVEAEINILEDLHVRGMLANHCIAQSMSDSALGELARQIDYKTDRAGGLVLWAPRFFPSTKRCSACGVVCEKIELSDREWTCDACGVVHDRDLNAALNLLWLGKLATSLDEIPASAEQRKDWIQQARYDVAAWREKREFSRTYFKAHRGLDSVGAASPEDGRVQNRLMREETAYRAERNFSRETVEESRTILPQGGVTHTRTLNG